MINSLSKKVLEIKKYQDVKNLEVEYHLTVVI